MIKERAKIELLEEILRASTEAEDIKDSARHFLLKGDGSAFLPPNYKVEKCEENGLQIITIETARYIGRVARLVIRYWDAYDEHSSSKEQGNQEASLNEVILHRILESQSQEVQDQVRRRLLISYWSQRSLAECPAELCPDTDDFAELPDPDFEEKVTELIKTYYVKEGTT